MQLKEPKNPILQKLWRFTIVTLCAFLFAINVKTFVEAGNLFPAGLSGITVLIQRVAMRYAGLEIPYSAVYIPLNFIPIYISIKHLGKRFTLYSVYVIFLSSILTDGLPRLAITYDTLLISIFGGILGGAALALALMVGASGGGMDFISIYFSEKKGIDVWSYIFLVNVVILITAGILFGFDKALYSIIFQYVSTRVLQLMYRRYQRHTLLIVTEKPDEIYIKIRDMTNHDATLFTGVGCYEGVERPMLYSVVSSEEVMHVMQAIKEVDPNAFVNSIKTERIGGLFNTTPIK